jgi:hypothetical protein
MGKSASGQTSYYSIPEGNDVAFVPGPKHGDKIRKLFTMNEGNSRIGPLFDR